MALRFFNNGYFAGKVGIGAESSGANLYVSGSNADATDKPTMMSESVFTIKPAELNSGNLNFAQVNSGNSIGMQFTNGAGTANWNISMQPFGGNVGIGTTSPQSKLDVKLSNDTTASIGGTISAGSFAGLAFGYSEAGNANYRHSAIVFERDDASFGDARGKIHILNSPSGSASADLGDSRLTILPNGKVGIGNTNPGNKLTVAGDLGVSSTIYGPLFTGYSNYVSSLDTRNVDEDPEDNNVGVSFDFKLNSTNGLSDGGTYNGQMFWRSYGSGSDLTGGLPINIAYTANGNLWTRMGTNATTWGDWQMILSTATPAADLPGGPYLPLSAGSGFPLTGTLYGTSTNYSGSGIYAGNMTLGTGASTAEAHLTIGSGRTDSGFSYIDLVGDATYTDYGLRIIRGNTGANTSSGIYHRGTGNLDIQTTDSSSILLRTNNTTALTLSSSQNATFAGNVTIGSVDAPVGKGLNIGNASPTIQLFDTTYDAKLLMYTQDSGSIIGTYSNHALSFFTNSTQVLNLDTSQNATFAGNITTNGDITITNSSGDPFLKLKTAAQEYVIRIDQSNSEKFQIRNITSGVDALIIDTSSNVSVSGDFFVNGGDLNVGSTSTVNSVINMLGTNDSFIEKDTGNHLYFANNVGDKDIKFRIKDDTTNIVALTIDGSEGGDSTFAAQAFSAATSSGDASSTLTTKGYVDGLITGATIYRGAWDPSGGGYGSPDLSGVTQTSGYYYICSAAGTAEPNGTGTEPDSWEVGDWVIYNDVSGTGQWQKIDNSSVLSGVGTGQTVALWEGAGSVTDSDTLGNSIITQSGATVASSQITLSSTSDAQLRLFSTNSWSGIYFDDFGSNPDHIWHNADAGTFALGGGGSNVINKKLHVHGGVTIGSGYAATAPPANGLSVEGNVSIGSSVINVERLYVEGKQYIESQGVNWNETTPGLTRGALHFDPVGDGAANTGNAITFGASDASNGTNGHAGIYTRSDGTYGTKMYFATTDSYALGSKTRMMIDSDGNVGIGTTSPDTLLQATNTADGTDYISYEIGSTEINVDNRGGFAIYELGTLQGSLEYYRDGTGRVQMASYGAGNPVTFATTASGETALGERMRIIPDGTVVIGATTVGYNTTQGYPLGVMSDLTSQSYISVARKGQTLGSDGLVLGLDTNNAYLQVRDNIPLILGTNNSSKVWILPSGHVGINVTAPAAMLDVQPTSTDRKVTRIANDVMSTYFYNTQVDAILAWTCGSYYQAEVVITANQTNGGTYNNLYIRGIWSNNHTSHHWDELERIGSLTGSTFTISVGQNGATTASGRLELDFDYLSGSFSQLNVRVTDFYGSHNYTIT